MAEADMAVAAGGITAYELAAAGVPAVLIPSHPREVPVVEGFAALGSAMTLSGAAPNDPTGGLAEALADLAISRARRVRMSRAGQRAVDGAGRRRVVAMILNLIFN